MSQGKVRSVEERLLGARKEGLDWINSNFQSIRAHGKVAGIETFSWINPDVDTLARTLDSFPCKVKWVGCIDQVLSLVANYPEIMIKIKSIVVYDPDGRDAEVNERSEIRNILCIDDLHVVLDFVYAKKEEGVSVLFTSDLVNVKSRYQLFEQYILNMK